MESGSAEDAQRIFSHFLPKAFRRPVSDEKLSAYVNRVQMMMDAGRSFEDSLRWTLRAALCSADFLFLDEPVASELNQIDSYALASRLSFFLWSSLPDQELLDLARTGKLKDPAVLRQQTERLLNDPKSAAFTQNFAHQWLDLRNIDATSPDTKLYPDFDEHLKQSMVTESELFFEHVLKNNLGISSFIDSDWLIINQRLAEHYRIAGVIGNEFRKVDLPTDSVRGGLMTQASVLKVTANGANTSPVTRGVWMLERLQGIHPPPPPEDIPAVVPDVTGAQTLRQLLEAHRDVDRCKSCHKMIDPPGFALESFDAIGGFRDQYVFQGSRNLLPVDSSEVTANGKPFAGIKEFKKLMLEEIDQTALGWRTSF
ncbi:MAG: DUF1592 domain-containing protein [Planctomycetota bacterium]